MSNNTEKMLSITSHQRSANHNHREVLCNSLRKDIITNTGNKNSLEGKREVRIVIHWCGKHKEMLIAHTPMTFPSKAQIEMTDQGKRNQDRKKGELVHLG